MAIGIGGFAAIIAVAALMVIGIACGNGAEPTSLSDEVPTPASTHRSRDNPVGIKPANYAYCFPRWTRQGLCRLGGQSKSGGSDG